MVEISRLRVTFGRGDAPRLFRVCFLLLNITPPRAQYYFRPEILFPQRALLFPGISRVFIITLSIGIGRIQGKEDF